MVTGEGKVFTDVRTCNRRRCNVGGVCMLLWFEIVKLSFNEYRSYFIGFFYWTGSVRTLSLC